MRNKISKKTGMWMAVLAVFMLNSSFGFGLSEPCVVGNCILEIIAINELTNQPIAGVQLVVNSGEYTTDINGRSLIPLAPGTFSIDARMSGYNDYSGTVVIISDAIPYKTVRMRPICTDADNDGYSIGVVDCGVGYKLLSSFHTTEHTDTHEAFQNNGIWTPVTGGLPDNSIKMVNCGFDDLELPCPLTCDPDYTLLSLSIFDTTEHTGTLQPFQRNGICTPVIGGLPDNSIKMVNCGFEPWYEPCIVDCGADKLLSTFGTTRSITIPSKEFQMNGICTPSIGGLPDNSIKMVNCGFDDWTAPCSVTPIQVDCNDDPLAGGASVYPGAPEICNGIDDDCNPATSDGSGETTTLNDNQNGVCAGSLKTCGGAGGWQNNYVGIANYEATETSCDGIDNNCDGTADEGCIVTPPSGPDQISLNHFYGQGVLDTTADPQGTSNYCVNGEGNFYESKIPYSEIGWNDCGPSILDPSLNGITRRPEGTIALSWTRQSSLFPVTYSVSYMMDGDASWTSITPSIAGLAYNWDVTGMPVGSYTVRLIPNDGRVNGTINTIRIIITENGRIDGYVTCGEDAVAGATVLVQGYPVTTVTTGNDGHYTITNAPVNSHEVVAYDEGRTTRQLPYSLDPTSLQPQTTVDFSNVCPVTLDCEADCTIVGGDICTAECNGVSGCSMNPLCVNVKSGLMIDYNETTRMRCCSGEFVPVSMEETRVELGADIEAEDITRTTRIVYYDGKPVKMIITVWE
ncbi:MAG TPA: MopE-related protein [Candidatus Nanoarchaeia archaeon]|nr:MopE-related protein [Candidatus Nanoarchaeia archaeon]